MIKQDLDINLEQFENMQHAIGFNTVKVKDKKYLAWRNYFVTSNDDESWDELVVQGLAVKRDFKLGSGPNPQCYSISREGFKFLENQLNIKIIVG